MPKVSVKMSSVYRVECWRAGAFIWVEEVPNLVVNAGLDDLLDKYFKGSTYSAAHYVGLKGTGIVAAGDTMASHAGWAELTAYDEAARPAYTPGSVSGQSVSNTASAAEFTINATVTVYGAFLTTNDTKGGTTGTLYGAVDFAVPRSVIDDDVLRVTITATTAAA